MEDWTSLQLRTSSFSFHDVSDSLGGPADHAVVRCGLRIRQPAACAPRADVGG